MTVLSTKPKPFCFVLMPFDAAFNDIYEFGIKGACTDAGMYCERVDEQIFVGSMLDRIFNQIARADILVADMTARNPNVFYEVGYAHALGKTVVLLTQRADDIPFDLKHFPHIVYETKIKELRSELARRLEYLTLTAATSEPKTIGLEIFLGREPLTTESVVRYTKSKGAEATLTVFNASSTTYGPGSFHIGVVAPAQFAHTAGRDVSITALPDGSYLHILPERETLFPGAYCSAWFGLVSSQPDPPRDFDLKVRVFSAAGFREFPLRFERQDG
jgi:hypothetical protein